jgi:hypothetical protein
MQDSRLWRICGDQQGYAILEVPGWRHVCVVDESQSSKAIKCATMIFKLGIWQVNTDNVGPLE